MDTEKMAKSLLETFSQIPDPRSVHGRRHPLSAILTLAVAAMLSGARSLYAIWQWGRLQSPEVVQAMGFTRGQTPAVSTLHLVFSSLDVSTFESALSAWAQAYLPVTAKAIAMDGKQLRGIHGEELPGVRLVAAFSHESSLVLAQQKGAVPNIRAS